MEEVGSSNLPEPIFLPTQPDERSESSASAKRVERADLNPASGSPRRPNAEQDPLAPVHDLPEPTDISTNRPILPEVHRPFDGSLSMIQQVPRNYVYRICEATF